MTLNTWGSRWSKVFTTFAFPNTLNLQLGYEAGHMWCSLKIFMEFTVAARFPGWKQTETLSQSQPAFKWTSHYKKLCPKGHPRRSNMRCNQCPPEFSQFTSNKTNAWWMGKSAQKTLRKSPGASCEIRNSQDDYDFGQCYYKEVPDYGGYFKQSLEPKIHLK